MRDEERRKVEYTALAIRLMIHLSRYSRYADEYPCPRAMTQDGISEAIGAHKSRVCRELKNLEVKNQVEHKSEHVIGVKIRMWVYFLTDKGVRTALKLKEKAPKGALARPKVLDYVEKDEEIEPATMCGMSMVTTVEDTNSVIFTVIFDPYSVWFSGYANFFYGEKISE